VNYRIPLDELKFSASRSSGAGGQNVNKVNTKVTLAWSPTSSSVLSPHELQLILASPLIQQRLTSKGEVLITVQETRSQDENKELSRFRLESLISRALAVPKKRVRTKPSRGSIERRITQKKRRSVIKGQRGKGFSE